MADSAPRKVHRQRSAVVAGVAGLAVCALLFVLTIVDKTWGWALVAAGAGAIVAAVLVLPCVVLTGEGVTLRNIVRSVTFTWPALDLVESRWNLKLFTADGKGYGSWAVAAQRAKPQGVRHPVGGSGLGFGMGARRDVAAPAEVGTHAHRAGSAGAVAAEIRATQEEHDRLVRKGSLQALEPRVLVQPFPLGLVLVIGGIILVVAGILLT